MPGIPLELSKQALSIGVKSVYGEPQVLGDVRIVPVALATYGFGGGSDGEGADGGGGGGFSVPVGAYVHRGGDVRFEPNPVALAAIAIPLTYALGQAVRGIILAARR